MSARPVKRSLSDRSHMPRTVRTFAATALSGQVGALVQQSPFGGAHVLHPDLFQMDQRPLPRTEGQMLQSADRKRVVVFRNGIGHARHSHQTAAGRTKPILPPKCPRGTWPVNSIT